MFFKTKRYLSARPMDAAGPTPASDVTIERVADTFERIMFGRLPLWWWAGLMIALFLLGLFGLNIVAVFVGGVGLWDINNPVVWGVGIVNLVFWIGIGHAGTFISAFLLLMRQRWRNAFARYAEGMTLFALAVAGLFPILHVGRPWYVFWFFPYPDTMVLNPQWRSALVWDFVAISTYGLVSLLFWYIDLVPDLATMRDKARSPITKTLLGFASLGWNGESLQWERLHKTSQLLAALATPLVISVHSIIGFDFAISIVPGWHHTVFPPYFVGGAVFSGFAMVILFGILLRNGFKMRHLITIDHLEQAAKLLLVTSFIVAYGYLIEIFGAWYSGKEHEWLLNIERMFGPYALAYWGMVLFNVIVPQALWFKQVRRNQGWLIGISILILIGMWLERFIIISVSLVYAYMPSMIGEMFVPRWFDWLTIIAPFGLFLTAMFLFMRVVPTLSIYENQEAIEEGHS